MSFVLVSDATFDLPVDLVEKFDIKVVPMMFNLNGKEYLHYPDERNMSNEEFYQALKDGKISSTSQINPMTYVEFMTPILESGKDILYICFTSGLSGTYQSALLAKDMLLEDFPERKIEVIDSLCASAGQGYFVYLLALEREKGLSFEELRDWAITYRSRIAHWFTVDDLFHLQRGGRLSFAEAMLGSALKIKPIISVDEKGALYTENKVRGNKKAVEYMISKMNEDLDESQLTIFVAHGDAEERAEAFKNKILEKTVVQNVITTKIGPIIGSHTGPGMLAVLFLKKV